jgi:diguanylate cyclase (GGDEF)-like protein
MDFDNFKRINDKLGHRYGDLVLIEIAHRLSRNIRMSDVAARFGGDEFVILAKDLENQDDVARFAQEIIKIFNAPIVVEKKVIQTSVSMGVALYPAHGKKPSELLHFSDIALYRAKKSGGNQYRFYTKLKDIKRRIEPTKHTSEN